MNYNNGRGSLWADKRVPNYDFNYIEFAKQVKDDIINFAKEHRTLGEYINNIDSLRGSGEDALKGYITIEGEIKSLEKYLDVQESMFKDEIKRARNKYLGMAGGTGFILSGCINTCLVLNALGWYNDIPQETFIMMSIFAVLTTYFIYRGVSKIVGLKKDYKKFQVNAKLLLDYVSLHSKT